jgi:hypothetical protein
MEKQLIGEMAPLDKGGELDMAQKPGYTGTPLFQSFAEEVPLSHTAWNNEPTIDHRPITKQLLGSEVPLNHTPRHGYESYPTPESVRSYRQSD